MKYVDFLEIAMYVNKKILGNKNNETQTEVYARQLYKEFLKSKEEKRITLKMHKFCHDLIEEGSLKSLEYCDKISLSIFNS